jgi:hypothetical protein
MTLAGPPISDLPEEELRNQYLDIGQKYWPENLEPGADDARQLQLLGEELRERFGYSKSDLAALKTL